MKNKIINIDELTDSRELLKKPLPRFIIVFIYIFLALLITLILWANFAQKEIVVKASGIVQAVDSNNIVPLVSGEIDEINVEEGEFVQAGDKLLVLNKDTVQLEESAVQEKIDDLRREIDLSKRYERSIKQGQNLFSQNDDAQKEYYYKYQNYQNQLRQSNNTLSQENMKIKDYQSSISESNNKISKLQQQNQKLQQENNNLQESKKQLQADSKNKQEKIVQIQNNQQLTEDQRNQEISNIQKEIENTNTSITQNDVGIAENHQEIKSNDAEIETLKANIKSNEQSISLSNSTTDSYEIQNDTYKSNELTQIQTQIKQLEDQIQELQNQLDTKQLQLEDYIISAKINGYVHYINPLYENDVIQAGTEIIKINTDKEEQLQVQLYIPSTEISNIITGQQVKIHSYSLPYREYGFIESKIDTIDIDSSITQDNSGSYYKAEILVDNKPLIGNDGQESSLKTGMPVEGQIITQKKSYLQLFMEKLDLWVNG